MVYNTAWKGGSEAVASRNAINVYKNVEVL